ncbi:MFS transporter [Streptomyces sp. NPDC059166]|uniref:MFS transporter n=1 Tax=Streptomyces sp. NPDC059166 TaxID=3346752 RepID=UPI0036A93B40
MSTTSTPSPSPAPPPPYGTSATPARGRVRLDRAAKTTVGLLFLAWIVDYIDRLVINLALPHIGTEFGVDRTQQGMILSAFFLAYAACQIPGGLLADRFGSKRILLWAMLVWSVFTALTGTAWSFAALVVIRVLFGAGQGIFPAAAMKAVAERTGPAERMTASGWISSSNAFGAVVAPLIAGPVIALWGWRMSFFAVAGLGVATFVLVQLLLPPARPAAVPENTGGGGTRALLATPPMWLYVGMLFGYGMLAWGLNSWIPSYLQTERGLSLESSGLLSALPALFGGIAMILSGRCADRLKGRPALLVAPSMAVAGAAVLAMTQARNLVAFEALLCLAYAACTFCFTPIFAVPLRTLSTRLSGAASGMINFGGQSAGILVPILMGYLADTYSFTVAFAVLGLGAALTAVLALIAPQTSASLHSRIGPSLRD